MMISVYMLRYGPSQVKRAQSSSHQLHEKDAEAEDDKRHQRHGANLIDHYIHHGRHEMQR
eukprot:4648572-Amphidinium_carterae.1